MRASVKYHFVDQYVYVSSAYDGNVVDAFEPQVHVEQLQPIVCEQQIVLCHRNIDLMCSKLSIYKIFESFFIVSNLILQSL